MAYFGVGDLSLRRGDLPTAIDTLERAAHLCRTAGIPQWFPTVAAALGRAYALAGRLAEGVSLLEQAVEQGAAMGMSAIQSRRLAYLGAARLQDGRIQDALTLAGDAVNLSRDLGARGYEAYALCHAGDVQADRRCGAPEAARSSYLQALVLAEELGMRPLQAHCRLGLGLLSHRMGERVAGIDLTAAAGLFKALDMPFWLAQTEARLAGVGA
jgi:tetratricopeptide (TPR) repeat protein